MIAIGCDHAAVELKNKAIDFLKEKGYEVMDFGCFTSESVDYPDYAFKVANAVKGESYNMGILICGTGIGMSMVANKVKGIRCAHCSNVASAKATRQHNDANILAIGARSLKEKSALSIIKAFVETPFSNEERHIKRIAKIAQIEKVNFK